MAGCRLPCTCPFEATCSIGRSSAKDLGSAIPRCRPARRRRPTNLTCHHVLACPAASLVSPSSSSKGRVSGRAFPCSRSIGERRFNAPPPTLLGWRRVVPSLHHSTSSDVVAPPLASSCPCRAWTGEISRLCAGCDDIRHVCEALVFRATCSQQQCFGQFTKRKVVRGRRFIPTAWHTRAAPEARLHHIGGLSLESQP